jgi:gamma-glutamyltranspeptidase/glutathione hydrolase
VEPEGFPAQWRAELQSKGHRLETSRRQWGNMQAAFKMKASGLTQSASDPRGADY